MHFFCCVLIALQFYRSKKKNFLVFTLRKKEVLRIAHTLCKIVLTNFECLRKSNASGVCNVHVLITYIPTVILNAPTHLIFYIKGEISRALQGPNLFFNGCSGKNKYSYIPVVLHFALSYFFSTLLNSVHFLWHPR